MHREAVETVAIYLPCRRSTHCRAALEAASLNVYINTKGLMDREFAAATDDDLIHDYSVFVCDREGNELRRFNILADFYKYTSPAQMKDSYSINIGAFDPSAISIRVVARDSWGNECEEHINP